MGCMKKYETVQEILKEFFDLRLHYYSLRKEWLSGMLGAESSKLNNQARFILEKIQGKITIGKDGWIKIKINIFMLQLLLIGIMCCIKYIEIQCWSSSTGQAASQEKTNG